MPETRNMTEGTPHYRYSETVAPEDVDVIHALLKTTYWASHRSRADIEGMLKTSTFIAAFHGDGLVGFARAVTDKVTFTWICDVVVEPEHRGCGIGKELVSRLMAHPHVVSTRKVLATRDAQGLYHQLGFITHPAECMIAYPERER